MMTSKAIGPALERVLPDAAGPGRVLRAVGALEQARLLDGVAAPLRRGVRALPLGRGRDALHGRWLGHPLHPVTVQLPVGAWMSSAVLDWCPGGGRAAATLIGVGLAGAGPAALAGWVDWAELGPEQSRVGLVHATLNVLGVACYTASLAARLTRRPLRGRVLALAGLAAISAGGALGGHLAYRQAAGANHAEGVARVFPAGWHEVGPIDELPLGRPARRTVGDTALLVVRTAEDEAYALADHCAHLSGPLSEGTVSDGCVRCPWHGSTFRLSDGWNVTGPATAPQPAFDIRLRAGTRTLEVRLRAAE
jgi:nitrite reductase/ring-hydroxylating ferredoxin subunit